MVLFGNQELEKVVVCGFWLEDDVERREEEKERKEKKR